MILPCTDHSFTRRNKDYILTNIIEWEELGEKLRLPEHRLREIRADLCHRGVSRQKSAMLDLWLQYDVGAGWERLSRALEEMDQLVLANKIRTEFMC